MTADINPVPFDAAGIQADIYNITAIKGLSDINRLPFSIKILLENALRNCDGFQVTEDDVKKIAAWKPKGMKPVEIPFKPGRVILQDFTGVPCVVDLAAMRDAMKKLGGDVNKINPHVRCDLVIDHSLQIDVHGCPEALKANMDKEFERNGERYEFLKWGQNVMKNFRVVPPGTGIIHQINLEFLADGVLKQETNGQTVIFPDTLVGTDSHTTMINGMGILGWGVGGIEAEAVMLGEPITMLLPEVVGFELSGTLKEGVTATDLVLTVVETLRKKGVVGKFVEFYGDGLQHLSLPDRAVIANMTPEFGATCGLFPVDEKTLEYYALTGRDPKQIDLVKQYMQAQGMFYTPGQKPADYTDTLTLDLSGIEPSIAGPRRPQDRITLKDVPSAFRNGLTRSPDENGFGIAETNADQQASLQDGTVLKHGSLAIASITSCTNTSNPGLLIAAGILARKAIANGLNVPSYVKTSLAPGSQVVTDYLVEAGLMPAMESLGFHVAGYGCATCIGNSGPLVPGVADVIDEHDLVAASVLSGNRNFEGRISPHTRANYLASPPLVVAYALAGRIDIDFDTEPIGEDHDGNAVFLKDIWPEQAEINDLVAAHVTAEVFQKRYSGEIEGPDQWKRICASGEPQYSWDDSSTYIQNPPFFEGMNAETGIIRPIEGAHVLVKVGDSITTDHISPAGAIAKDSPAGKYLIDHGVDLKDFNSYGSRRGNDRVMARGTFANIRLRNQLAPGTEGSWTTHFPTGDVMSIFDAAQKYREDGTPLVILAGKEYGTGSSRDWAAKGPALLGVRIVIAESYERIHRSNLAGMGILPLQFKPGESAGSLGLQGNEIFDFENLDNSLRSGDTIRVRVIEPDGQNRSFSAVCRLDTPVEIDYFRNGGILQTVIKKMIKESSV
ncbi:MAG: aconitate hydratase AcnA [Candidatus Omnitrophota bacterium]